MADKPIRYMKFRNQYGQVLVAYNKTDAGMSFRNPKDFNCPREIGHVRGVGIALKRLTQDPVAIGYTEKEASSNRRIRHLKYRQHMLRVIKYCAESVVHAYRGIGGGDFLKWFHYFIEEEQTRVMHEIGAVFDETHGEEGEQNKR